jgi:PAS domain S-box-containing protein
MDEWPLIVAAAFPESSIENIERIINNSDTNYKLLSANSHDAILESLCDNMPEVLLLNNSHPKIDSIKVIKDVKNNEKTCITPILIAIDGSSNGILKEAFTNGIVDFISTPFKDTELINRLNAITLKHNKYNELLKEIERFKQLAYVATETSNSVILITTEGKMEWVNQGFEDMYEYDFLDFKDKFEDKYFNPSNNEFIKKALEKKISDKDNIVYDNKWLTKSGNEKWIQTTLSPIFDEVTAEITKIIAIETDITQLKKTEERLEEKNNNLLQITKRLETTNEILEKQQSELEKEKKRSEDLLLNILPFATAQQLKRKGYSKLRNYKMVTVMFADFKGFTKLSEKLSNQDLIKELSSFFEIFDEITIQHHIEKIKTMGDCYMGAGGLPLSNRSNPFDVVLASLEIQNFVNEKKIEKESMGEPAWKLRVGIHTGELIAGVIGKRKFAYDIWGDTVNTASRMETAGETGKVNISGDTYTHIKDYFECTYRGKIEVKYKGEMEMYFVERLKPEFSGDEKGIKPNEEFIKILSRY